MKGLDINKLRKEKTFITVSSKETLKDVIPMNWNEKAKIENIKELREKTGVSISLCKEALENCNGDIERSIDYIRYKVGIARG